MCLFLKEVSEETGVCQVVTLLPGSAFLCRIKNQNIILCGEECNGCSSYIHKEKKCRKENTFLEGYSNNKKEKVRFKEVSAQKNPICATC